MFRSFIFLVGVHLLVSNVALAQRPVLSDNFERNRGDLTRTLSKNDHLTIVREEGVEGSKAIQANYQGNDEGSERITQDFTLRRPGTEFTLCYDVKFAEDFEFVKGGKLPGLGPDKPVAGGDPIRPDGWSVRMMWKSEGGLISYIYHQDQPGKYGDGKKAEFNFERGRYHALTLQVTVNTSGDEADGRVAVYVDGEKVIEHEQLKLRGTKRKEALIEKFLFSTFYGGSSSDWAPRDENGDFSVEKAWFDNFAIYKGRVIRKQPGAKVVEGE